MKDILWYEGLYEIDKVGTIYSRKLWSKIKKTSIHPKTWYEIVHLYKDGVWKPYTVHRLVAQAFLKNPDNKKCVNHINWERDDNRIENLEYMTHSENLLHSFNIGILKRKWKHHLAKKVKSIDKKGNEIIHNSIEEASISLWIARSAISNCLHGWSKTSKGYNFIFLS